MLQAITNNFPGQQTFRAFRSGSMDIFAVTDGEVQYNNACFAPGIPRPELQAICNNQSAHFSLAHNILVFVTDNRIILIDAGNGHNTAPEAGNLAKNLGFIGIHPGDVTDVVLTHAHPDHINGLITISHQLMFPEAVVHISEAEYNFWLSDTPDFLKSKNSPGALITLQQNIRQVLAILKNRLQLFNGMDPLFNFLQPVMAAGHTPGHCMFSVTTGKEPFVHMADICHDATVLFNRPEWGTIFDIDFKLAAHTRQKVLADLAGSGQLAFGYHMPWPGFGRVIRKEGGFAWVPEEAARLADTTF